MTNLEMRKLAMEKEAREIAILERAENTRKLQAENVQTLDSLFLSLKNQPLFCRMPLQTVTAVKTVFQSKTGMCSSSCFFHDTCRQIISLSNKKTGRIGKTNNGTNGKQSSTPLKRNVSYMKIEIVNSDTGKREFLFTGNDWKVFSKACRDHFKTIDNFPGLTTSAVAGFTHKGKDNVYEQALLTGK
jgi:hypothetical protein